MQPPATFGWRETRGVLAALVAPSFADGRVLGVLDGESVACTLPLVQPPPRSDATVGAWLADLPAGLGTQCVLLLRAGASALGLWDDDELVAHKVFRRYVVRGKGRAQPAHLATKGKSRYGSRLRLQNARRLLEETNERLTSWWTEHGPVDRVFVAAPVRLLADLRRADPPPPFAAEATTRIPWHVHEPSHEELLRVRRKLERGRIDPAEPP